jgi:hypothetical protein
MSVRNHERAAVRLQSSSIKPGHECAPALCGKTNDNRLLRDLRERQNHIVAADSNSMYSESAGDGSKPEPPPLTLLPPIVAEIKLDGERSMVHVDNGYVSMVSRNNVNYTQLYAPSVGPPLREALGNFNVDVILDGEMLSYNSYDQTMIDFGVNRMVAGNRLTYMQKHNMLDKRDMEIPKESKRNHMKRDGR